MRWKEVDMDMADYSTTRTYTCEVPGGYLVRVFTTYYNHGIAEAITFVPAALHTEGPYR